MEKPDYDAAVQRDGPAGGGEVQAVASADENGEGSAEDVLQVVGEKARLRRRKTASKAIMTKRIRRVQEISELKGSRWILTAGKDRWKELLVLNGMSLKIVLRSISICRA